MTTAKRSIGRIEVCAELVADTPLRIGSARSTSDIDLTVLRDGRGRVLVPGDSLAGAMRAWASTAFRNEGTERENRLVNQLFGQAVGGGSERLANAGLVTVSDAAVDATVEARTGVGIDRATGAAAPEVFYSFEVVCRCTSKSSCHGKKRTAPRCVQRSDRCCRLSETARSVSAGCEPEGLAKCILTLRSSTFASFSTPTL